LLPRQFNEGEKTTELPFPFLLRKKQFNPFLLEKENFFFSPRHLFSLKKLPIDYFVSHPFHSHKRKECEKN